MTKQIPLTQDKFALVDDDDYPRLNQWKWATNSQTVGCYAVRYSHRAAIYMHREIMRPSPGMVVDHINGNGLDNRRANLRIVNTSVNNQNRKLSAKNRSGYHGVSWDSSKQKWRASISVNNHRVLIGRYDSLRAAALAYNQAAMLYFGAKARLNEVE